MSQQVTKAVSFTPRQEMFSFPFSEICSLKLVEDKIPDVIKLSFYKKQWHRLKKMCCCYMITTENITNPVIVLCITDITETYR